MPNPRSDSLLDLTAEPLLFKEAQALRNAVVHRSSIDTMAALAEGGVARERTLRIAETLRRLETTAAIELMKAIGKASLTLDPASLRVLFGTLEVKRPGGEVLRQLESLTSLERMALQLVGGRWPKSADAEKAAFSILEVLEEGARADVIDLALESIPRNPNAVSELMHHLSAWFTDVRTALEGGAKLPEEKLQYLTHVALVEIHCLEDRLCRLATRVDPYDGARVARLLPLLSRYDQDIEHMKDVVSRLSTYQPFYERRLTVEHALSDTETDRLEQALLADPDTAGIGRVLGALRGNPLLDRPFAALVSVTQELALRRTNLLRLSQSIDLHSLMLGVLETVTEGSPLRLRVESMVIDSLVPDVASRGWRRPEPDILEIMLRDDQVHALLEPDGMPRLALPEAGTRSMSLKDLVRTQLRNDGFTLGILENPRANTVPGIVEIIAGQCRSLRVLDKIARTPSLYTGAANKNVAAQLLMNPSRIPLTSLRRFMSVRFVSRVDLTQMTRNKSGMRPEVVHEIDAYLRTLRKS